MRRAVPVVLAVPLLAGPAVLAFAKGGYFDGPRLWAGIAAWVLVAAVALTDGSPLPRATAGRVAVGGLAALTALTAASLAWAPIGGQAIDDLQRLLLYLGVLVAGIAILRAPGPRRAAEPALLAGIAAACVWALADRLGAIDLAPVVTAGDRLAYPLTYWNASGAFAALGLVLAAGIGADGDRPAALRAAAVATAPVLGLTLILTLSRGAVGAAATGLAVLLAVAPTVAHLRAVALTGAAAAVPVAAAAVLGSTRTTAPTTGEAVAMTVVLIAATALAAAAALYTGRQATRRLPRLRPAAVVALAVVLAGSVAAVAAADRGPSGTSQAARRLASAQSNRYEYWRVAADSFAHHPLAGVGSGGFQVEWLRERRVRGIRPRRALAVPGDRGRAGDRRPRGAAADVRRRGGGGAAGDRLRGRWARRRRSPRAPPGRSTPGSTGTGRCPRSRWWRWCSPRASAPPPRRQPRCRDPQHRQQADDPADPPAERPVGELDAVRAGADAHAAEHVVHALDVGGLPVDRGGPARVPGVRDDEQALALRRGGHLQPVRLDADDPGSAGRLGGGGARQAGQRPLGDRDARRVEAGGGHRVQRRLPGRHDLLAPTTVARGAAPSSA